MWPSVFSAITGIWLMASSEIFGYSSYAADNDHICGPLIVSFGIIAFNQVTRPVRRINTIISIWLFISAFFFDYQLTARINIIIISIIVLSLSLFKGKVDSDFNGGWIMLFKKKE